MRPLVPARTPVPAPTLVSPFPRGPLTPLTLFAKSLQLIGRRTSIAQEGGVNTVTSPCLQYMIENDIVEELRRINDEELEVIFMGETANAGGTKEIIVSAALEESPLQVCETRECENARIGRGQGD